MKLVSPLWKKRRSLKRSGLSSRAVTQVKKRETVGKLSRRSRKGVKDHLTGEFLQNLQDHHQVIIQVITAKADQIVIVRRGIQIQRERRRKRKRRPVVEEHGTRSITGKFKTP